MSKSSNELRKFLRQNVVLDVGPPYVYVGRLAAMDERFIVLEDADVHDLRDSTTTRDVYVLDTKRHGVRANRTRVVVSREHLVSLSALDDVIE